MFKDFSDPIHGFIRAQEKELKLIDSLYIQRLRYVKQLGVAYLVFPSAHHTRFEHSLGVMELTKRMCKNLGLRDKRMLQIVSLAALLHDIGHPPFSHTTEVLLGDRGHEAIGYRMVLEGQVGDLLKREGFSKDEIEIVARLAFKAWKGEEERFLSSIVTGEFGTDRLDYLRRDAYFCGTSYGFFDYERLLTNIALVESRKVVNISALKALESFVLGRYFMYSQVYFHKVVRILNIHLLEMVERFFGKDYFQDTSSLLKLTDGDILSIALQYPEDTYVRRLINREHFREVFSSKEEKEFKYIKGELLQRYSPDLLRFDLAEKNVLDEDIYLSKNGHLVNLKEVSDIVSNLKDIKIYRVYADRSIWKDAISFLMSYA
ncbi:MAG: HD domain-containing protein [Aquificaceae bacterium]